MRQKMKGFLQQSCRELSGQRSLSYRRLGSLAASDCPRLKEPLFLLALESRKLDYLLSLYDGTRLGKTMEYWASLAEPEMGAEAFLEDNRGIGNFGSVRTAYLRPQEQLRNNRKMNAVLREQTLEALKKTGMSRYRLCTELKLNKGNVYAYLAGDMSKVSKDTARRIMEFATAQQ